MIVTSVIGMKEARMTQSITNTKKDAQIDLGFHSHLRAGKLLGFTNSRQLFETFPNLVAIVGKSL